MRVPFIDRETPASRCRRRSIRNLKYALGAALVSLQLVAAPQPASAIYENGTSDLLLLGAFKSQTTFDYTGGESRSAVINEEEAFLIDCLIILRAKKNRLNRQLRNVLAQLKTERNSEERGKLFNLAKEIGQDVLDTEKEEKLVEAELAQLREIAANQPPLPEFQIQTRRQFFSLGSGRSHPGHATGHSTTRPAHGSASTSKSDLLVSSSDGLTVTPTAAEGTKGTLPVKLFAKVTGRTFDESSLVDRDGDMAGVIAGAMFGLTPNLSAGIAFNYSHLDASSRFLNTKLDMDSFGFSAFVNSKLPNKITLDALFSYAHGSADVNFGVSLFNAAPISGSFDTDTFSFAARLGRKWRIKRDVWIEPNATVSYTVLDRESFTDSRGAPQAGSTLEHGRIAGGVKIGHSFFRDLRGAGPTALSHGTVFGAIEGVYDFRREDNVLVVVGLTNIFADTDPAGFNLSAGSDLTFANGMQISAVGQYQWRGDYQAFGGSVKLAVPLN
ncbi:MAG: autotransporter domain-containing protein [Pseudomonadota bacterium]